MKIVLGFLAFLWQMMWLPLIWGVMTKQTRREFYESSGMRESSFTEEVKRLWRIKVQGVSPTRFNSYGQDE